MRRGTGLAETTSQSRGEVIRTYGHYGSSRVMEKKWKSRDTSRKKTLIDFVIDGHVEDERIGKV